MHAVHLINVLLLQKARLCDRTGSPPGICLFRGLKEHHNVAFQLILDPVQLAGHSGCNGSMHIMPAGVHNSLVDRGIGGARLLRHGKGDNIRPQAQGPGMAGIDADKPSV